jgi:hypothetical protein
MTEQTDPSGRAHSSDATTGGHNPKFLLQAEPIVKLGRNGNLARSRQLDAPGRVY